MFWGKRIVHFNRMHFSEYNKLDLLTGQNTTYLVAIV